MKNRHLTDEEIQDILDGNISEKTSEQRNHLKICDDCQQTFNRYQNLYIGLEADPQFQLPKDFAKSVISKISQKPSTSSAPIIEIILIIAGAIAAFGVMFLFVDIKSITQTISRISFPKMGLDASFLEPMKNLLSDLNINLSLLPFTGLALLSMAALDRIINKLKQHRISH